MKNPKLIITVAIFLAAIGAMALFMFEERADQNDIVQKEQCLESDEEVVYSINRKLFISPVDVVIKNKNNDKEIFRFVIDSALPVYDTVQPRKCALYVVRGFNFDYKRYQPLRGFRVELWRYKYNGEGELLLALAGEDNEGKPTVYYSYEYQTDFLEKLIALIEGYLGDVDKYAALMWDVESRKGIFPLKYTDIVSSHPLLEGNLGLEGWTKDSRYFWGRTFIGANVLGFFRVERDTWKVDILPAPEGTQGGDALNVENGYVTYNTGPGWIGIQEVAEEVYDEWRKEGKIVELYVYNLFTKEKTLLATSSDPSWWGGPRWISDTELEYELPDGEERIYKIR